jgi:tRNA 2-thiouridine synthesizing protein A
MAVKFEKKAEGHYMLDVLGYVCPHPQIYTKKAMEKLSPGDVLEVVFDNPSSSETIGAMCEREGHKILERHMEGGKFTLKIQKQ